MRNPSLRVGTRGPAWALPIAFGGVLGAVAYFVFNADLFIAVAFPVVAALVGLPSRQLAFMRRGLTSGLEIEASTGDVRRGAEFEVLLTVPRDTRLAGVDVGLVCTEVYDESSSYTDSDG